MTLDKFGRCEIQAIAGRGGMAIVYRAYDPQLGRAVAIKVLPREFCTIPVSWNDSGVKHTRSCSWSTRESCRYMISESMRASRFW